MNEQQISILENMLNPLSTKEVLKLTGNVKDCISEVPHQVEVKIHEDVEVEIKTRHAEKTVNYAIDQLDEAEAIVIAQQEEKLDNAKKIYKNFLSANNSSDFPIKNWLTEYRFNLQDLLLAYQNSSINKNLNALEVYTQEVIELYNQRNFYPIEHAGSELFKLYNTLLSVCGNEKVYKKEVQKTPWLELLHRLYADSQEVELKKNVFTFLAHIEEKTYHPNNFQYFILAASYNHEEFLSLYEKKLQSSVFMNQLSTQIADLIYNTDKKLKEDKYLVSNNFLKNHTDYFACLYLFNLQYFKGIGQKNIEFSHPSRDNYVDLTAKLIRDGQKNYINTFALENMAKIDKEKFPMCTQLLTQMLDKIFAFPMEHFVNIKEMTNIKVLHEKNKLSFAIQPGKKTESKPTLKI